MIKGVPMEAIENAGGLDALFIVTPKPKVVLIMQNEGKGTHSSSLNFEVLTA
jgi:hypothetical protein